jgi:hypothetical protein
MIKNGNTKKYEELQQYISKLLNTYTIRLHTPLLNNWFTIKLWTWFYIQLHIQLSLITNAFY